MKKFFRWFFIALGGVVLLFFLVLIGLKASTEYRLHKKYEITPEALVFPDDSATIARGQHIASISCAHCHGDQMQGTVFFKDPSLGQIIAPNLTVGKGGVGTMYKTEDFVRAIRHGVRPNGDPLLVMPSQDFCYLTDKDLAAVISYIRQLPAVDNELPGTHLKLLTKELIALGAFGESIPAEVIDHTAETPDAIPAAITPEYGDYLVSTNGCTACHGQNLAGAKPPDPASPYAPNLTMGSISIWKETDFIHAMRTGERPAGQAKMSEFMPWKNLGRMTDDELKAVWAYMQTVPKVGK